MADSLSAPVLIRFIRPDGERQNLGAGDIDATGHITVTDPAAGMADYLGGVIDELNQRTYIIVKEPPAEGADRFSIGKRKVQRDEPDFITELAGYAARVMALDLEFDATVFTAHYPATLLDAGQDLAPQTDAADPISDPYTPDPDDIDADAPQIGAKADDDPPPTRPESDEPDTGESADDDADADLSRRAAP